ncbi:ABC transporter ATP-binding protein [bacterium]|nr:MAG: ABC transporter ATP-binding protein [bacterium]
MSLIIAKTLAKSYGSGEAEVKALKEASFTITEGEFVSVMGESGSGKSTLLSILGALNTPTEGNLEVAGIDVYSLSAEKRADFRREFLGFVFQNFRLIPYLTLAENTMLPLAVMPLPKAKKIQMAQKALAHVGLAEKMGRLPSQVSGGEQERAAVARAIVNEPPILLADEPTGNLDSHTAGEMMELLKALNGQGMTVVMVTHSEKCDSAAWRHLKVFDGVVTER